MKKEKVKSDYHDFNDKETAENINKISRNKITISIKSSISVTVNANLAEALTCVDKHPNSIKVNENYIRFFLDREELVEFRRVFFNSWNIELNANYKSISHKYLTNNAVKAIIINLYHRNSILDLLEDLRRKREVKWDLSEIIDTLQNYIKSNMTCRYCQHKIAKIEQEYCEFCGTKLNIRRFLYQFIFN